jgi:hypothetical protein
LVQAVAARRQVRFFDDEYREAVLDLEPKPAAFTNQVIAFELEARLRSQRAAQQVKEFRTDHQKVLPKRVPDYTAAALRPSIHPSHRPGKLLGHALR